MIQLGIIAALPAEARSLLSSIDTHSAISSPFQLADNSVLMISGIGADQAAKAATKLIQHGADALLSWGCAGALSGALHPGDLLLPIIIKTKTGQSMHTNKQWHAHLSSLLLDHGTIATGALVESAEIIAKPVQKQILSQSSGAVAVDMESAAIALMAHDAGIPFMAIRAIADDLDSIIPVYINQAMDAYGNMNSIHMLGLLLTHPASWCQLMRLGWQFNAAKTTLSLIRKKIGIDGLLPPRLSDQCQ